MRPEIKEQLDALEFKGLAIWLALAVGLVTLFAVFAAYMTPKRTVTLQGTIESQLFPPCKWGRCSSYCTVLLPDGNRAEAVKCGREWRARGQKVNVVVAESYLFGAINTYVE